MVAARNVVEPEMTSRIGVIVTTVLALLGGVAGFMISSAYSSYSGFNDGAVASCRMLAVAETKSLVTPAQRREIARSATQPRHGDASIIDYFASDCTETPFHYAFTKAKTLDGNK